MHRKKLKNECWEKEANAKKDGYEDAQGKKSADK